MLIEQSAPQDVVTDLADGRSVVVVGCAGSGGVVFAAARAAVQQTAFAVRHSSGFLCVALPDTRCDELELPPIAPTAQRTGTTLCVTVDAEVGVSTGISAADRARTARVLADVDAKPADLARPGHLVPVAVDRAGHSGLASVALDLVERAGLSPAAVYAELVSPSDETRMADDDELRAFAADHGLPVHDASAR